MKALLISIHPQWVELILNLIKKDEIRKGSSLYKAINKLIEEQGVAPMLIYCTKGKNLLRKVVEYDESSMNWYQPRYEIINDKNCVFDILNGKVVARFNATADLLELKMIEGGLYFAKPDKEVAELDLNENAQIDNWQLLHYTGEKLGTQISDIHINDLEIFDEPKEISEFKRLMKYKSCNICPHLAISNGIAGNNICKTCEELKPLTRAPHSYCFIEI